MKNDAAPEAAGEVAGGMPPPGQTAPGPALREVPPPTAEERHRRREAMLRAISYGATPYRDAEGRTRHVAFTEANQAPVAAWRRERDAKRGFRRVQQARKAAGQLAWHPEDQIELAKRLGALYHREGRSVEGATERGLYDAIWRYEHVFDSFTLPRRFGRDILETGRIAAVAEKEARRLQAADSKAKDGFWVRDRRNTGLIYVVPNAELAAATEGGLGAGEGVDSLAGGADIQSALEQFSPADDFENPTESYDPSGFYQLEESQDGSGFFVLSPGGLGAEDRGTAAERRRAARYEIGQASLGDVFDGLVAVLDTGRDADDPAWQQLARIAAEVAPGTGHLLSAREAYIAFKAAATALENDDWEEALLNGGEALLNAAGAVPVLGDLLRLGKGAVRVANLLLRLGRVTDAKVSVLAATQAAGKGTDKVAKSKKGADAVAAAPDDANGGRGGQHRPSDATAAPGLNGVLEPVGEGIFGPVFTATGPFSGKKGWKKVVDTLRYYGTGEVPAALYHKETGLIDVVWGKPGTGAHDGYGLSKLLRFHPDVEADLPSLIREMVVVKKSKNRIQLESSTHNAGVRLDWDGTKKRWLLTAFRKTGAASR